MIWSDDDDEEDGRRPLEATRIKEIRKDRRLDNSRPSQKDGDDEAKDGKDTESQAKTEKLLQANAFVSVCLSPAKEKIRLLRVGAFREVLSEPGPKRLE